MATDGQSIVALTMGDPAGIGPEIVAKFIGNYKKADPVLVVVGDEKVLTDAARAGHANLERVHVVARPQRDKFVPETVNLVPIKTGTLRDVKAGHPNAASGRAAMASVEKAADLVLLREVDAVVTAPIVKKAINDAGFYFTGHTDYFAHRTNTSKYTMCFVADDRRVAVVTSHLALRKVHSQIRLSRIIRTITLLDEFVRVLGVNEPRIVVAGLNPHAGESGLLGAEEQHEIRPAVESCRSKGLNVEGPVSCEAAFAGHLDNKYDAVVAMYHDQGLVPLKVLAPYKTVNVTLGLPFIRTSVGHGAALDIAGRGVAKIDSLKNAVTLAAFLARAARKP